jgi:hypothetical protein
MNRARRCVFVIMPLMVGEMAAARFPVHPVTKKVIDTTSLCKQFTFDGSKKSAADYIVRNC